MLDQLRPAAKALTGAAASFAGAVATGYADGTMTPGEWWTAAAAALVTLGGVYAVRNTHPPEDG